MRLEIELSDGGGSGPAPDLPSAPTKPPRRGLDRFELSVLGVFAAISVYVLALDLWRVVFDGAVWTGTDGVYIVDQLQYLAWIRDASHHFLVSNLFVLRGTPGGLLPAGGRRSPGGLTALGVPVSLSLLLWKPVAVGTLFFAVRAYARRSVAGVWPRRAVLVLTLFFGSFTLVYGTWSVLGRSVPRVPVLGLHVRAAGARLDGLGARRLRRRARGPAGGCGCPACSARWPASFIRGTASC